MKTKLAKSPVKFIEENHTYWLGDDQLSGITKIISKYIFPDMYKGVDKKVLNAAADHGHKVHEQVQRIVNGKLKLSAVTAELEAWEPEIPLYLDLVRRNKIKMMCSEYLVSDNMFVASSIDIIDKDLNLYDIKTTDKFHREYVRWQLSIYAFLFELQNPGLKVGKLYGIHLRDGANLIEVERIPDDIIRSLLFDTYAQGVEVFNNPLNTLGEDEEDLLAELKQVQEDKKKAEARESEIKDIIMSRMKKDAKYSIIKDGWKVTRSADSWTKKFDDKALKKYKPSLWRKFSKDSKVSGRLTITFAEE